MAEVRQFVNMDLSYCNAEILGRNGRKANKNGKHMPIPCRMLNPRCVA